MRDEKKLGSAERDAQHRQLQARDLARHLRRHAGVGQDLVEQAADDVDHHVIERAARGLAQLLAVGADQVDRHQAGQAVAAQAAGAAAEHAGPEAPGALPTPMRSRAASASAVQRPATTRSRGTCRHRARPAGLP